MGWFGGPSKSENKDPYRDLDPELKDFLDREAPAKHRPEAPEAKEEARKPTTATPRKEETSSTNVPPPSLYQDGRYAHLWKDYKPLKEIEDETKSDQEKLMDVLEGYKDRKSQISRIAQENCVAEQLVLEDCYENGSLAERMLLCRKKKKAFHRCYLTQKEFLKALGYLSTNNRPSIVDEEIQMHADTLYHRMLAEENTLVGVDSADAPTPQGIAAKTSSFVSEIVSQSMTPKEVQVDQLPALSAELQQIMKPQAQLEFRKLLRNLTAAERDIRQKSKFAEFQAERQAAEDVKQFRTSDQGDRKSRREAGKDTAADTVSGWFGW